MQGRGMCCSGQTQKPLPTLFLEIKLRPPRVFVDFFWIFVEKNLRRHKHNTIWCPEINMRTPQQTSNSLQIYQHMVGQWALWVYLTKNQMPAKIYIYPVQMSLYHYKWETVTDGRSPTSLMTRFSSFLSILDSDLACGSIALTSVIRWRYRCEIPRDEKTRTRCLLTHLSFWTKQQSELSINHTTATDNIPNRKNLP